MDEAPLYSLMEIDNEVGYRSKSGLPRGHGTLHRRSRIFLFDNRSVLRSSVLRATALPRSGSNSAVRIPDAVDNGPSASPPSTGKNLGLEASHEIRYKFIYKPFR